MYQEVDVAADQALLAPERRAREAGGHRLPQLPAVLLVRCILEMRRHELGNEVRGAPFRKTASAAAHHVAPGARIRKGQLVRCDAYDGTIFLVEGCDIMWGKEPRRMDHVYGRRVARYRRGPGTWASRCPRRL